MIEVMRIEGRDAYVVYLDDDLQPAEKGEETLVKVIYQDNGETIWLGPPVEEEMGAAAADRAFDQAFDQWLGDHLSFDDNYARWMTAADVAEWREHEHPRKKSGQFAKKGAGEPGEAELADVPDIPPPPQIRHRGGEAPPRYVAQYQRRIDTLYEHAQKGEWDQIEAFPAGGVNTQARMVRRYKEALLKYHAEAPPPEPEPEPEPPPPPEPERKPPEPEGRVQQVWHNILGDHEFRPVGVTPSGGHVFHGLADGDYADVTVEDPNTLQSAWSAYSGQYGSVRGTDFRDLRSQLAAWKEGKARPDPEPKPPSPEEERAAREQEQAAREQRREGTERTWRNTLGAHGLDYSHTSSHYGGVFTGKTKGVEGRFYDARIYVSELTDPDSAWEVNVHDGITGPRHGTGQAALRQTLSEVGFPAKMTPEAWSEKQAEARAKKVQAWHDITSRFGLTPVAQAPAPVGMPTLGKRESETFTGRTINDRKVTLIVGDPAKPDSYWHLDIEGRKRIGHTQKDLHKALLDADMVTSPGARTGGPPPGSVKAWTPPAPKDEAEVRKMSHQQFASYFTEQLKGSGIHGPAPGERIVIRAEHRANIVQTFKWLAQEFPLPKPISFRTHTKQRAYASAEGGRGIALSEYWFNGKTPEQLAEQNARDNRVDPRVGETIGFHDNMTDPMADVVHEYGHIIDAQWATAIGMQRRIDNYWSKVQDQVSDYRRGDNAKKAVSRYALTNNLEWFAEAFAALKYGDERAKTAPGVQWLKGQIEEFIKDYRDNPHTTASGRERWQEGE